jgi:hypothetical protein
MDGHAKSSSGVNDGGCMSAGLARGEGYLTSMSDVDGRRYSR